MSVHYIFCLRILTIFPLSECVIVWSLFVWPWKIDNSKNNLKTILSLIIWQIFLCFFFPNNNLLTNASNYSIVYSRNTAQSMEDFSKLEMVVHDSNHIWFFVRYPPSTCSLIFSWEEEASWFKNLKIISGSINVDKGILPYVL